MNSIWPTVRRISVSIRSNPTETWPAITEKTRTAARLSVYLADQFAKAVGRLHMTGDRSWQWQKQPLTSPEIEAADPDIVEAPMAEGAKRRWRWFGTVHCTAGDLEGEKKANFCNCDPWHRSVSKFSVNASRLTKPEAIVPTWRSGFSMVLIVIFKGPPGSSDFFFSVFYGSD
jgi:hypothetical protein